MTFWIEQNKSNHLSKKEKIKIIFFSWAVGKLKIQNLKVKNVNLYI